jgi:hydroxyacylglutathione hydrolase
MAAALRVRNALFESNSYLWPCAEAGRCVVVDPGLDQAALFSALEEAALRPAAVVCTHGHFDHVGRAHELQERFGSPVFLHRDDARTASGSNFLLMAFRLPARIALPRFEWVDSGAAIRIGGDEVRFRHAPGHTPGSCVVTIGDHAFTGDTLYRDGIGLVSLPGEDEEALRRSIRGLWGELPEEAVVSPGHGDSAPFGRIKRENRPLRRFLGMEG